MKCKNYTLRHQFNGDRKKPGPLLIVELVMECPPKSIPTKNAWLSHKWHGSGSVKKAEMKKLVNHLHSRELTIFANYLEISLC